MHSFVSVVIKRIFLTNVAVPVAVFPDLLEEDVLQLQELAEMLCECETAVQVELTPLFTENVPCTVNVQITVPSLS